MASRYVLCVILSIVLVSCTKEVHDPIKLSVTLTGEVFTTDEFGYTVSDRSGIAVATNGSDPANGVTDEGGKYSLVDLFTGTYNISFSKEGYGTYVVEGFQLIGGDVPTYLNVSLIKTSSTKLSGLTLTTTNDQFVVKGAVNHNYPYDTQVNGPRVIFFLSDDPAVSGNNYKASFSRIMNYTSGANFNVTAAIDKNIFPSGTTVYVIGYGVASYDTGYLDIEANTTIYPTLNATPSNVVNINVP